ncbi:hypothetical protein pb186bvf_001750 [Paramecium bursaria]
MNQIRFCIVQGHQKYQTYHVCTFIDCNLTSRWCCPTCLQKETHKHKMADQSHILNQEEFQDKLKQDLLKMQDEDKTLKIYKKETLKQMTQITDELLHYVKQFQQYLNQQLGNIVPENQLRMKECIKLLDEDQFTLLDNEKINHILQINQECKNDKFNNYQNLKPIEFLKDKINQLEILSNQDKDVNLLKMQYKLNDIDQTDKCFFASQISNNEKYLVYGGYSYELNICDLQNQHKIQKKKLEAFMQVCQFTEDSSKLFIGSYQFVYGFDTKQNFNQIYRQFIHEDWVNYIICDKNECIITCSDDKTIIKTNTKTNEQIFRLVGHTNDIIGLDYDYQNEFLISASKDQSIKVWNCQNKRIILNKENAHQTEIRQIQLINQKQNLLSLDSDGTLYLWKMDLTNKDLINIRRINDTRIFNFYFTYQNQQLLLICQNQVKILNNNWDTCDVIDHICQEFNEYILDCKQLHNANYIQTRAKKQIILAVAQNRNN